MIRILGGVVLSLLLAACSGTGSGGTGGGTGTGGSGSTGGGTGTGGSGSTGGGTGTGGSGGGTMAVVVPDPGASGQVDQDWTDVEPNDTPGQATPLGRATGDIYVWVGGNNAGGSNSSDYFVFKSAMGPDAGTLSFDMCYGSPITAMTANLWKVSGGVQQMPAVATWASSSTCVTNNSTPLPLAPDTTYLFGLSITGGAGMYSA